MKKYQIVTGLALIVIMSGNAVFASSANKEAKSVEREAKETEREAKMSNKKAEVGEKINAKKVEVGEKITNKKNQIETKKVSIMCNHANKSMTRLKEQSKKRKELNTQKLEDRLLKVEENRTVRDEKLKSQRQKRDEQRDAFYVALNLKAQTDEQYTAVETFKTLVEDAVETRRASIDEATVVFREAVDALVESKKTEVEKLYYNYEKEHNTLIDSVQSACDENTSSSDLKKIAKDLNAEMKKNREQFRNEVQQTKKISPEIQELVTVRKDAVQDAIDLFKETVDVAKADLLEAFNGELEVDSKTEAEAANVK